MAGDSLKTNRYKETKKNRLLTGIVAAGFILGVFLTSIWKNPLLEGNSLLMAEVLNGMKYIEVEAYAFFLYVLQKRMGAVFLMILLSTTWMGVVFSYSYATWLGISAGTLLATAVAQYGGKGIFLVLIAVFPQILIYAPVTFYLLDYCYEFCMMLYYPHKAKMRKDNKESIKEMVLRFLPLLLVVITGCILESYVNPILVKNFLKIF